MLHRIAGLCPVIVQLPEINAPKRAEDPAKVKSNGIVSSFSSAAAGFRLEVSWNVAGDA